MSLGGHLSNFFEKSRTVCREARLAGAKPKMSCTVGPEAQSCRKKPSRTTNAVKSHHEPPVL